MKKVIILAAIMVSGCSADGRLGREGSPAWHKRLTTAEKVQYFTPTCIEYGFKRGSAKFKQCVVNEIRASKAAADARVAAHRAANAREAAYNAANRGITCRTVYNTTRCKRDSF